MTVPERKFKKCKTRKAACKPGDCKTCRQLTVGDWSVTPKVRPLSQAEELRELEEQRAALEAERRYWIELADDSTFDAKFDMLEAKSRQLNQEINRLHTDHDAAPAKIKHIESNLAKTARKAILTRNRYRIAQLQRLTAALQLKEAQNEEL